MHFKNSQKIEISFEWICNLLKLFLTYFHLSYYSHENIFFHPKKSLFYLFFCSFSTTYDESSEYWFERMNSSTLYDEVYVKSRLVKGTEWKRKLFFPYKVETFTFFCMWDEKTKRRSLSEKAKKKFQSSKVDEKKNSIWCVDPFWHIFKYESTLISHRPQPSCKKILFDSWFKWNFFFFAKQFIHCWSYQKVLACVISSNIRTGKNCLLYFKQATIFLRIQPLAKFEQWRRERESSFLNKSGLKRKVNESLTLCNLHFSTQ